MLGFLFDCILYCFKLFLAGFYFLIFIQLFLFFWDWFLYLYWLFYWLFYRLFQSLFDQLFLRDWNRRKNLLLLDSEMRNHFSGLMLLPFTDYLLLFQLCDSTFCVSKLLIRFLKMLFLNLNLLLFRQFFINFLHLTYFNFSLIDLYFLSRIWNRFIAYILN